VTTVFAVHADATIHLKVSRAASLLHDVELVGRSVSALEALRIFDTLAPDAVTLDARLPDGDGIDLAQRLRSHRPHLCVVVIGPAVPRLVRRAVAAGALAYVPKTADVVEMAAALEACLSGGGSFSSDILNAALRADQPAGLSPRESQVVQLARDGLTSGEIAVRLDVRETTVRTYVARVRAKLGGENDLPSAG
jgi:DNA-binding NarL/FixJ family response regulator